MIGKLGGAPWTNAEEPLMNPRTVRILGWCYLTAFERPSGGERMARDHRGAEHGLQRRHRRHLPGRTGWAARRPPDPHERHPWVVFARAPGGAASVSRRAISPSGCRPTSPVSTARLPTRSTTSRLVSERRARETARVSHAVGKEGKLKQRMTRAGRGRRVGRRSRRHQHADRRPGVADDRSDARGRRGGQGRSRPVDGARSRRPPARRASSCARRSWSTR